jgi:hypothetical protein
MKALLCGELSTEGVGVESKCQLHQIRDEGKRGRLTTLGNLLSRAPP